MTAVDGLCLEVRPGEVVGLLGPEAAGNSTTVGKILGLIDRDAGRNEMLGQDLAAHRRVERREVGAIIEQTAWDIG